MVLLRPRIPLPLSRKASAGSSTVVAERKAAKKSVGVASAADGPRVAGVLVPGMDEWSLRKRQEDKICALGLNSPGVRALLGLTWPYVALQAVKINAINARRAELLREQKAMATGLRRMVGEDIVVQSGPMAKDVLRLVRRGNVKAQQVAVKKLLGPLPKGLCA